MKMKKTLVSLLVLVLMASLPVLSLAESDFGSSAVTAGQTYTTDQMLTYAIQDEYMAQAEYAGILSAYGSGAPFSNIINAEGTHVTLLKNLFTTYGLSLPENTAASKVTVPNSLEEAYQTGIQAENANIAMYDAFLTQEGLPEDVRNTFTALKNASQSHLAAFTRNTDKSGLGLGRGAQNGRGNNGSNGLNARNSNDCLLGNDCIMTRQQNQNGGKGRHGRN